jgi:hypothetical protein
VCRPPRPVADRQMWGILYPPLWWGIITATETFGLNSSPHTLEVCLGVYIGCATSLNVVGEAGQG